MKLSEYAKAHNYSYQMVWRWFKNGTLPVKASQLPSGQIVVVDEEEETGCDNTKDRDYKIVTTGNITIEKNYAEEVSSKLDILLKEVNILKNMLSTKEVRQSKEQIAVLTNDIAESLTDTDYANKLEQMEQEKRIKSEALSKSILAEMAAKQKKLTEKLTSEERGNIGFKRAKLETVPSLIKACKELIAIEDKKNNDMCPSIIKNILDKIKDFIDSGKDANEEEKQLFEQMKHWYSNKQIKFFIKQAYLMIESSFSNYSKEDVSAQVEKFILLLKSFSDHMDKEQNQTMQDICSINELLKKHTLPTAERTREFFEAIVNNELIEEHSKLSLMILAIKEMHNYIGRTQCMCEDNLHNHDQELIEYETNSDVLQIKTMFLTMLEATKQNMKTSGMIMMLIGGTLPEFFVDQTMKDRLQNTFDEMPNDNLTSKEQKLGKPNFIKTGFTKAV